jgi:hypothetical protein
MNYPNALSTLQPAWARLWTLFLTREWRVISRANLFAAALHRRQTTKRRAPLRVGPIFIHKLGICLKELRESRCWIRLVIRTELLPEQRMGELYEESDQLCNIIAQSIVTAKENREKKR